MAVTDGLGRPVRAPGLGRWLQSVAPARAAGLVTIALVPDGEVRSLNKRYRRVDLPTDVLAFPNEPDSIEASGPETRSPKPALLGDLVIATGVARRQAASAGHSYATELKVLALHGLLHLLGYDHHARDDNGRMARMESRLRRAGGLSGGLIERAGAAPRVRAKRELPARRLR